MQNKKLYIVITPEFDAKLSSWCKRLAVSKSQLIAMAAQAGMDNIIRAIAPAESIPVDLMAQLMEALEKRGFDAERLKGEKKEVNNEDAKEKYVQIDILPTN